MRKLTNNLMLLVFALMVAGISNFGLAQTAKSDGDPSATQAVILTDDFESYSTAAAFPAGSWVNHNSSTAVWSIVNDETQAARQTAAVTNIISNGDTAWTNYKVSARVKAAALGFRHGIVARFTTTSAYYSLYLRTTSTGGTKVIELNKRSGSTNVVLQTVSIPVSAGVYYKLTLEVNGSNIKGYVDDALKVQATDADYANGKVGFYNTGETFYDDLIVEDASTAPAAPTNLAATAGDLRVGLIWTAATGAASYTLKRSTTDGGSYQIIASNLTTLTYTDTTVTDGTTYYYVVTASSAAGESANSNQASATPQVMIPGVPGSVESASGDREARIYWVAIVV